MDRQKPALVLVHGLVANSGSWRFNIPAFSEHFTVLAPDLPLLPIAESAEWLADWLDGQGIGRCHFLGVSAGGAAVLALAAAQPSRVDRLVLAAPVHPFWKRPRLRIWLAASPAGELLVRFLQPFRRPLTRFVLKYRLYADPKRVSSETVDVYAEPFSRATLGKELRRFFSQLELPGVPARWPHPTLLVWGDRDRQVSIKSASALATALNARLEVISGGSHMLFEERAEEFNRGVLKFLLEA
jgi:pimeloyl-ACP methyl ester carboxylesterase